MKPWSDLDDKGKVGRIALILAIVALLFWNPMTRSIIVFILPLGSGYDDLIFIAALVFAIIFGIVYYTFYGRNRKYK